MFLIVDKAGRYTFYLEDPKDYGFKGPAGEVDFDFPDELLLEKKGKVLDMAQLCLGQSKANPKQYQAFATKADCEKAGFTFVGQDNFTQEMEWKPESDKADTAGGNWDKLPPGRRYDSKGPKPPYPIPGVD